MGTGKGGWLYARQLVMGALVCGVSPVTARSQAAVHEAASTAAASLSGEVVDSVTGMPVPRALVMSVDRRLATLTDSKGHFTLVLRPAAGRHLGDLASTTVYLSAQKPGFYQREGAIPVVVGQAQGASSILKLVPFSRINGRVDLPTGDLRTRMRVLLLQQGVQDGVYEWQPRSNAISERDGTFRFPELREGEYTVMVQGSADAAAQEVADARQDYAALFYGDTTQLEDATEITLHAGENTQVAFHPQEAPFFPVVLPLAAAGSQAQVSARVLGQGSLATYAFRYDERTGAMVGALPDGNYNVLLSRLNDAAAFAVVPVHVADAPVQAGQIALVPAPPITLRLHTELTTQRGQTVSVRVSLRPTDWGGSFVNGSLNSDTVSGKLENAQPGSYRVTVQSGTGYVAAVTAGGVDLFQERYTVGPTGVGEPIDITVRNDGAGLSGTVVAAGGSSPSFSFIFLTSANGGGRTYQAYAGPDGAYNLSNVAPGSYLLLAVADPQAEIPYRDPEATKRYEGQSKAIHLEAGEQVKSDVPLIDGTGHGAR